MRKRAKILRPYFELPGGGVAHGFGRGSVAGLRDFLTSVYHSQTAHSIELGGFWGPVGAAGQNMRKRAKIMPCHMSAREPTSDGRVGVQEYQKWLNDVFLKVKSLSCIRYGGM